MKSREAATDIGKREVPNKLIKIDCVICLTDGTFKTDLGVANLEPTKRTH